MFKKILAALILMFPLYLNAQDKGNTQEGQTKTLPDMLDFNKREIIPTYNAFYMYGGFFYGDSLGNSYLTGADYSFSITKNIAVGPSFAYSRAKYSDSLEYSLAGFFKTKNIFILDLTGMLINPVAINMGGAVVHADLFMIAGVGSININDSWEPHGLFGGGMRIYIYKSALAVRVDMRTNFHSTNKPAGGNNFDQDLEVLIGLSMHFTPRKQSIPKE